jgi:uncharacterized membrane protein
MKVIQCLPLQDKVLCVFLVCGPHFELIFSGLYSSRHVNGVVCICTFTKIIPPITYAFVAALAFSGLNASVGYLTNILGMPVAQVILIRNVSRDHLFR